MIANGRGGLLSFEASLLIYLCFGGCGAIVYTWPAEGLGSFQVFVLKGPCGMWQGLNSGFIHAKHVLKWLSH